MRRTTIRPVNAGDDMRRDYERQLRRHLRRRSEVVAQTGLAAVLLTVVLAGSALALHRHGDKPLPRTAFEVAAEREAAAREDTSAPKPPSKPTAPKAAATGGSGSANPADKPPAARKTVPSAPKSETAKRPAAVVITPRRVTAAEVAPQKLRVRATADGFVPSRLTARADVPIELTLEAAPEGVPAGLEIPSLMVDADNATRTVTVRVPAVDTGTYPVTSYTGELKATLVVR
jgi:hypothetical protein